MKFADDVVRAGRARWPRVVVTSVAFAAHCERLGITESQHAEDLYLACACAAGDAAAIACFDDELAPIMRAAVRRIDRRDDFIDEVVQVIRERVLVAEPGTLPRIAEYTGQGPLRAWVRIAAMRIAMNMRRDRRRDILVDDDRLFEAVAADHRPGSAERYREAATDALRAAFAALSPRERNLLRMHYLHELTVDELAPSLGVHRATVARWIAAARERLLAETRTALASRLEVGEITIDSILKGIASEVEVSVVRLLAGE